MWKQSLLWIYHQSQVCYMPTLLIMRDGIEHPARFVEASRKKAKLEELSNNIGERWGLPSRWVSEANEGAGILSDLLLSERSEFSGKSAIYYIITVRSKNFDGKTWYSPLFIHKNFFPTRNFLKHRMIPWRSFFGPVR